MKERPNDESPKSHGLKDDSPKNDSAKDNSETRPVRTWMVLVLLAAAELLGMSLWMTASAVSPQLAEMWQLTSSQAAWLTTIVQLGFVVGTAVAALFNVADIIPNRHYFVLCALLGGVVNALLLLEAGYAVALIWRFLTGFLLAGVYPPAMKMIATWFQSARGLAIGTIVGALTIGKASPYLIKSIGGAEWQWVVGVSSLMAIAAAALVWWGYRDGPYAFARRPFSLGLVGTVIRDRPTRLAIFGYLGHMWELYAMWIWVPIFLASAASEVGLVNPGLVEFTSFATIAAGGLGCVWGGWIADKIGREHLVNASMVISGACCVVVGFGWGGPFGVIVAITLVWGFFVVADSAQFSTLVTEVAPNHAVGTALTLQTSLGFCLTAVSIQLIPLIESALSWRYAFACLALGPAFGVYSIMRLKRWKAN